MRIVNLKKEIRFMSVCENRKRNLNINSNIINLQNEEN